MRIICYIVLIRKKLLQVGGKVLQFGKGLLINLNILVQCFMSVKFKVSPLEEEVIAYYNKN